MDNAIEHDEPVTAQVGQKTGELVGQAKDKAQPAVGQARERVRSEVDRRSTQAGEQLSSVAEVMRRTGADLRSQGNEPHGKVADAAAERLGEAGDYLQRADADTLLSDVEDLARRQPLVVIAGGLVLGLAAARFLKASSDRRYDAYRTRTSSTGGYGGYRPPATADRRYGDYTAPVTADRQYGEYRTPATGV